MKPGFSLRKRVREPDLPTAPGRGGDLTLKPGRSHTTAARPLSEHPSPAAWSSSRKGREAQGGERGWGLVIFLICFNFVCLSAFLRFGKRESRVSKGPLLPHTLCMVVSLSQLLGAEPVAAPLPVPAPLPAQPFGVWSHPMPYSHLVQQRGSRPGGESTNEGRGPRSPA